MARPLRPNIAGGIYHAMARGNERRAIYLDDLDHTQFLRVLERVVHRHGWQCLAFCLMGSHYHLVVRTPKPNLSRGMGLLNGTYAARFNARHDRVGHLFQGRFRSVLIQDPVHLLIVLRYVIRNPVAGDRCKGPDQWPWSSYHVTLEGTKTGLVAADQTLAAFGGDSGAGERFVHLMATPDIASIDSFPDCALEFPVEQRQLDPRRPSVEALIARTSVSAGIAVAHREYGYSLSEIGRELQLSRSAVGRRLVAFEAAQMLESESWPHSA